MKHHDLARSRSLFLPLACAALLAAGASAQQPSQQPEQSSSLQLEHRASVAARYAMRTWTRGEERTGLANALPLDSWKSGPLQSTEGLLARHFRASGAERPSFVLETLVTDSVDQAHEQLLTWLAGLQSPNTMPSTAERGLRAGDVGFVGRSGAGPDAVAWVAFARGNVAVRVSAMDPTREPDLDLGAIAEAVDAEVLRAPLLGEAAAPPRPRIVAPDLRRTALVAGERLRLDLAVEDPAQGEPHLEWIVGGPGQGYVERDAAGDWVLHTTGPGEMTLVLEVTGSTGTWARREFPLDVLREPSRR